MIGRADIEGSKSNVAMNAWLPQASSVLPTRPFWTECFHTCVACPEGARQGAVASGRSSYLKLRRAHTLPSVEPNPCGNFSGTSSLKFRGTKGSIGHTFMVCIHTENQNQGDFYPFVLLEISVLHESPLGHLRYGLTDVPPQPNSPPDNVFNPDQPAKDLNARSWALTPSSALLNK
ncbi:putative uncharacterized protein ART2 [Lachnellula cervina]|uniref:Senescence-associated protein n=1 Tax=Lachnellula cervina TaxID=1316786 RepID=A0A7D8YWX5_9HELO|nr:putative uncharacterized protein ART2 [Lachnellula cervina]